MAGKIYKVDATGKAPAEAGYGDIVVTGGGTYRILDKNPDGTNKSLLIDKDLTTNNYTGQYANPTPAAAALSGASDNALSGVKKETAPLGTTKGTSLSLADNDTDMQQYYDKLFEAQKQSKIAGIKSAYDSAVGNATNTLNSNLASLDTTQGGIRDTYYKKRNDAAAASDISQMNFAQYMGARGIKGNAGGMPEIYRNAGLQNTLGSLDKAEAQDNANIDIQKTLAKNNYAQNLDTLSSGYASDVAAAGADVDAAALQTKIAQLKDAAEKATAQTTADKNEWINNIGQFSGDFQAEINRNENDGDTSNDWQIPYLRAARQDKINALAQAQASALEQAKKDQTAADQQKFENDLALKKLALESETGSGSGSNGLTFSQMNNAMQNIYTMNLDSNYKLTNAGRQALYNYATQYGGKYASQLMAAWGVTGAPSSSGVSGSISPAKADMLQRWFNSNSQDTFIGRVQQAIANGQLTEAEYDAWANSR